MREGLALTPEDITHAAVAMRAGSKSFHAASLLLPRRVRAPATVVYAFCRIMDDAVDGEDDRDGNRAVTALPPETIRARLDALRARLDRVYEARPHDHPVDRALAHVVRVHDLPRAAFDAMIEGFAWDVEGRVYETLDDVVDYGVRVAGTVGVTMSVFMGRREAHVLDRACELGVAMQLTNIARDVGEDAARGRLYLPRAWLREAGVDPDAFVASPRLGEGVRAVVLRLLDAADALYRDAAPGVRALPWDCRPSIRAAATIYAAIGHEVRCRGGDAINARASVPTSRKAWLLARSVFPSSDERRPPAARFAAARFLIDAVAR